MRKVTVTETKQVNELVIQYTDDAENPRKFDGNVGYFITVDSKYISPDDIPAFKDIIKSTGDIATSQENHIQLIEKRLKRLGNKVITIVPISRYEHGNVRYSIGSKYGFDYSNNGFYIVTEKTLKATGIENDNEKILKAIEAELETYNKWANGEIYEFILYNSEGEVEDSVTGFYDIEDIKEYLPEDWKEENLTDYLI